MSKSSRSDEPSPVDLKPELSYDELEVKSRAGEYTPEQIDLLARPNESTTLKWSPQDVMIQAENSGIYLTPEEAADILCDAADSLLEVLVARGWEVIDEHIGYHTTKRKAN